MSVDWVLTQLVEEFGKSPYWWPTIILFGIISLITVFHKSIHKFFKNHPKCYKNSYIISFFGLVLLLYNIFIWKQVWVYIIGLWIVLLPLFISRVKYLYIERGLDGVITICDSQNLDNFEVIALQELKTLLTSDMTEKQLVRYKRHKMYILTKLGDIRAAEKIMEELGADKLGQAHYHLFKYIVAVHLGDIGRAHQEIIKARDVINDQTEPIIQFEIRANLGVSFASQKNYHVADDCFNFAIQEYKRLGLNDKMLLSIIYNNYAFNKAQLNTSNRSWEDVLSEYKTFLDFQCIDDRINYFNLELQMLRQTNASRDILNKVVKEAFDTLLDGNLAIKDKLILAGSFVRIVWSAMLDPTQCLSVLNENYNKMNTLYPIARYRIHKELSLLFNDLHGELPERYSILRDQVRCYMDQKAENDIQDHRRALPDEAVFERCYCLKELAGIERKKQDYDVQKVISFLNDTVKLYQDNSLLIDEIISRLNIMDELCAIENMDENFEPLSHEEMKKQLFMVESLLPKIKQHPIRAEIGIRMSFYCLLIHEYDKCIKYYDLFNEEGISLNHFAPWLHRYRMCSAFAVRILHFKNIIFTLRNSQEVLRCTNNIQEWFQSFPNHDGIMDSMLLARFIGYSQGYPIKTCKWFNPQNPNQPKTHSWFYFSELGLNADITYDQFKQEDNKNQIFFNFNRHPFESNRSRTIAKDLSQTELISGEISCWNANESNFSPTEKEAFNKINELINNRIPNNCPALNELQTLFKYTMMPVASI